MTLRNGWYKPIDWIGGWPNCYDVHVSRNKKGLTSQTDPGLFDPVNRI